MTAADRPERPEIRTAAAGTRVSAFADDALGATDATGVAERIASGEISAQEAVDAWISRISLPLGRTADDRPVGVMLSARLGDERRLLEIAFDLEEASPFASLAAQPH